ncbi:MAG: phosphoribosyl-ATP diphosphatase [Planctomycetota bacterium]
MENTLAPLKRLMQTLRQRADERPEGSYTTKLINGGVDAIGDKVREEALEFIEAAGESGESGRQHAIYEAGDLLYHAMVLMAWRGIDLDEVVTELARREGTSGLDEKASRTQEPD